MESLPCLHIHTRWSVGSVLKYTAVATTFEERVDSDRPQLVVIFTELGDLDVPFIQYIGGSRRTHNLLWIWTWSTNE
ncbi:BQ5605_C001g00260 [Microbotryum silenes-dioicae]|uniref:BQ5605_C001g00207 protein n=1 Tax=Microbotryum silenes-dioicae TaxID=796604 RepID=A0A2X0M2W4_9BASI|nr:BQ5605_C001g00207 [Microbotryum silenes-dioicae]SGY45190.1 BQ5605_C001g00260 [Microbotryum silenes-dioicae]